MSKLLITILAVYSFNAVAGVGYAEGVSSPTTPAQYTPKIAEQPLRSGASWIPSWWWYGRATPVSASLVENVPPCTLDHLDSPACAKSAK